MECKWLITSAIDRCHPIVFEGGATHLTLIKSTTYTPRTSMNKCGPGYEKGSFLIEAAFLVPYDDIFSNQLLDDLDKIWELRYWIPDPTNPLACRKTIQL